MTRAGIALVVVLDLAMAASGGVLIWRHVEAGAATLPKAPTRPVVSVLAVDAGRPIAARPTPPAPPANPPGPPTMHGHPTYTSLPNKPPANVPVMTYGDAGPTAIPIAPPPPPPPAIDAAPPPPPPPIDAAPPPPPEPPDAAPAPIPQRKPDVEVATESVRGVVNKHRGNVTDCYRHAARMIKRPNPFVGRLEIQLRINADGTPQEVKVIGNDTGSDDLATCVAGLMASWHYPNPNHDTIEVVWPFTFRPATPPAFPPR